MNKLYNSIDIEPINIEKTDQLTLLIKKITEIIELKDKLIEEKGKFTKLIPYDKLIDLENTLSIANNEGKESIIKILNTDYWITAFNWDDLPSNNILQWTLNRIEEQENIHSNFKNILKEIWESFEKINNDLIANWIEIEGFIDLLDPLTQFNNQNIGTYIDNLNKFTNFLETQKIVAIDKSKQVDVYKANFSLPEGFSNNFDNIITFSRSFEKLMTNISGNSWVVLGIEYEELKNIFDNKNTESFYEIVTIIYRDINKKEENILNNYSFRFFLKEFFNIENEEIIKKIENLEILKPFGWIEKIEVFSKIFINYKNYTKWIPEKVKETMVTIKDIKINWIVRQVHELNFNRKYMVSKEKELKDGFYPIIYNTFSDKVIFHKSDLSLEKRKKYIELQINNTSDKAEQIIKKAD